MNYRLTTYRLEYFRMSQADRKGLSNTYDAGNMETSTPNELFFNVRRGQRFRFQIDAKIEVRDGVRAQEPSFARQGGELFWVKISGKRNHVLSTSSSTLEDFEKDSLLFWQARIDHEDPAVLYWPQTPTEMTLLLKIGTKGS